LGALPLGLSFLFLGGMVFFLRKVVFSDRNFLTLLSFFPYFFQGASLSPLSGGFSPRLFFVPFRKTLFGWGFGTTLRFPLRIPGLFGSLSRRSADLPEAGFFLLYVRFLVLFFGPEKCLYSLFAGLSFSSGEKKSPPAPLFSAPFRFTPPFFRKRPFFSLRTFFFA